MRKYIVKSRQLQMAELEQAKGIICDLRGYPNANHELIQHLLTEPDTSKAWMRVVKHDGSQHHGVGIQPDIYVDKTIKGVREGRDEFLEKAVEIAKSDKVPKYYQYAHVFKLAYLNTF